MTEENTTHEMPDNLVKITVQISFDPNNCKDVDAGNYDPEVDLDSMLSNGVEVFNVVDWEIVS